MNEYPYAIVGAGLAGAQAVNGLRSLDETGPILMVGAEADRPYHRPDLSKKLWVKEPTEKLYVHPEDHYETHGVDLRLSTRVTALDRANRTVTLDSGETCRYGKLLLATGGTPRRPDLRGADLEGLCYYRTLADFRFLRPQAVPGSSAVVLGGGFIGSELVAALSLHGVAVSWLFPEEYLCARVFPRDLAEALEGKYREHHVQIVSGEAATAFEREGGKFVTHTRSGARYSSDMVVIGIGIEPEVALGRAAGLETDNGLVVNELLQTSDPDIYAAGDNANFPSAALGQRQRIEHWDHARSQGKAAGKNMVAPESPYTYLPYFFSDLYDFGYEAVGQVDARLQLVADWQQPFETGVLYYLQEGRVRGAMMCGVWEKVPEVRELIKGGQMYTPEQLRGLVK